VIPSAGTSVRNPVDIGLVLAGAAETYRRALEASISDPGVDAAVVIGGFARGDEWQGHIKAVAELRTAQAYPPDRVRLQRLRSGARQEGRQLRQRRAALRLRPGLPRFLLALRRVLRSTGCKVNVMDSLST
jgi:hypothetical protein